MTEDQSWFCAQLGAREHYAVPRALQAVGALRCLLTDFWAGECTRKIGSHLPLQAFRALAGRHHVGIPPGKIRSWNFAALQWEARLRLKSRAGGTRTRYEGYCEVGRAFGLGLVRYFERQRKLPDHPVFWGYDTCSLEIFRHLQNRGVQCILGQIDPCREEMKIVREEQDAWPGWETEPLEIPDSFLQRHDEEWTLADKVIVNSEWSRQALLRQGVPEAKLQVIPLSYESDTIEAAPGCPLQFAEVKRGFAARRPLRVLFLGQVNLRKGIQYLMEAARVLQSEPIRFEVVGPVKISRTAVASAPANMQFHGRATRNEIARWYRAADIFVLPTLSDGFAITQLEAMANRLPVIATPNCGDVVGDHVNGRVVPPRSAAAIAEAILSYLNEPHLLLAHSEAAVRRSTEFSIERLGDRLRKIPESCREGNTDAVSI